MLKSYLKTAIRNLRQYKAYSVINIAGLSIGLASGFIILLYIINDLSYDAYNKNLDRIYILTTEMPQFKQFWDWAPFKLGPIIRDRYPEVDDFSRVECSRSDIKYGDKNFGQVRFCSSDTNLFNILTLPLVSGSLGGTFTEKDYAVLSTDMAEKCFHGTDPIGKVVTISCLGKSYDLKVTAVMQNIPRASTLRADIIVPLFVGEDLLNSIFRGSSIRPLDSLNYPTAVTYVLLHSSVASARLDRKLGDFSKEVSNPNFPVRFHPFPLKDVYFHSADFANNVFPTGDISNLYIYSAISILTLLIACLNFVILSTGRAVGRTKEMGVRKVIGATKSDIILQMLAESVAMAVLALPIAFALIELFLPRLSQLIGRELPTDYFLHWNFILMLFGITIVAGILSGGYVSFYLSGFQPVEVLRENFGKKSSRAAFRRILITAQMVIFIGLITASITVYRQLRFVHTKDFGFNKDNLIVLYKSFVPGEYTQSAAVLESFKTELKSNPDVVAVSGAILMPGTRSLAVNSVPDKLDPAKKITYESYAVDRDYFEAMGMKIIYGKSFGMATPEESKNAVIMNETAINSFGIKDPSQELFKGSRILGVVKDFNMHSLHEKVAPIVFTNNDEYVNEVAVRVSNSANLPKLINFIETKSKDFNNGKPMEYQFFDDRLDELYGSDYKFADTIGYFTGLAIFIACLGLIGVSLFVTQTRVKEIGVRKTMGASVNDIIFLITREFVAMLLIATAISTPVVIYFMNRWLQNYAYHIGFDVYTVMLTICTAMVIVFLTVGYQAIKAATSNPVEALRYE